MEGTAIRDGTLPPAGRPRQHRQFHTSRPLHNQNILLMSKTVLKIVQDLSKHLMLVLQTY